MCFIVAFNATGAESSKLNKDNIQTTSKDNAVKDIILEDIHTPKLENKSENANIKKNNSNNQEPKPLGPDEAIAQNTQKVSVEATKSKAKREIDPKKPMVALTFDDGPHPQYTMDILNSLE